MFNLKFLNELRIAELHATLQDFPSGGKVLEFGAGTGMQAKILEEHGYDVIAIDLRDSSYTNDRVFPVLDYDGISIPVPDASVDLIYSSNVLEHVDDLAATFREFQRILKPEGRMVHLMPTVSWRAWTFAAGIPTACLAALQLACSIWRPASNASRRHSILRSFKTMLGAIIPIGHGTSWEGISELWTFSALAWRAKFERNGFHVISIRSVGLFHTGHMLFGPTLRMADRRKISSWLGSAAMSYMVQSRNI